MDTNAGYNLIVRLKALRDLLREGEFTKPEIFMALPQHYQPAASGTRRLTRDIRALRTWGYEITINRSTHVYTLQETTQISLSNENVQTLALIRETFAGLAPLSADVLPILQKVVKALPPAQQTIYASHQPLSIQLKPAADYHASIHNIRLLESAVEQGRKVRFVYPALDGQQMITHVGVEPYEIQFFDRHFYLLGFTPHDLEMLEFRVDRIESLEVMAGKTAKYRKRKTIPFTYHLSAQVARKGISERFLNQQVTQQADGSAIIQAEGYSPFRILQELMRYGEQVELLSPPDLRLRMEEIVRAMTKLYRKEKDK